MIDQVLHSFVLAPATHPPAAPVPRAHAQQGGPLASARAMNPASRCQQRFRTELVWAIVRAEQVQRARTGGAV